MPFAPMVLGSALSMAQARGPGGSGRGWGGGGWVGGICASGKQLPLRNEEWAVQVACQVVQGPIRPLAGFGQADDAKAKEAEKAEREAKEAEAKEAQAGTGARQGVF